MRVKVGDLTIIKTGKLDANASSENGNYPFFTCSNEPLRIDSYSYDCECVLIAGNGDLNVKYYKGKFDAYQRTYIIQSKSDGKIFMPYLYLYFQKYIEELRRLSIGGVIKYIKLANLTDAIIDLPSIAEQKRIVNLFKNLQDALNNIALQKTMLDDLVKSRFVEMFGDPKSNPYGWKVKKFEDISILITDGEHSTPKRTHKGIYLLSARNVLNHRIQLDDVDYIDEDEYERIAKRLIPTVGDVLISCSGSIGRCCVVPKNFRFQMVRSTALIRFKNEIRPLFAEWLITSDELQRQIMQSATQSSQANLFQGKIKKLYGYVPPLDLQDRFIEFAREADKSKFNHLYMCKKHLVFKKTIKII